MFFLLFFLIFSFQTPNRAYFKYKITRFVCITVSNTNKIIHFIYFKWFKFQFDSLLLTRRSIHILMSSSLIARALILHTVLRILSKHQSNGSQHIYLLRCSAHVERVLFNTSESIHKCLVSFNGANKTIFFRRFFLNPTNSIKTFTPMV